MRVITPHFVFETVTLDNLETLRQMRNSRFLQPYMHHQQPISQAQQTAWFKGLRNSIYYLVLRQGEHIGYAMIKDIDREKASGEPGTFLIREDMLESSEAALFVLTFLDYCYFELGIKIFHGNVLFSNTRALKNYEFFAPQIREKNQQGLILESTDEHAYLKHSERIRKALAIVFGYAPSFKTEE
ncbi:hypothetical protein BH09BAC1_BH09BAC1_04310 [soil metagenome]